MLRALWSRAETEAQPPTPIVAPLVAPSAAPAETPRAVPRRRRTKRRVQRLYLPDEIVPTRQPSAQEHARRLLAWLHEYGLTDKEVLADDLSAYNGGDYEIAIPALEFAAAQDEFMAEYYLARIYADNSSSHTDHAKAYMLFQRIADKRPATKAGRISSSSPSPLSSTLLYLLKSQTSSRS